MTPVHLVFAWLVALFSSCPMNPLTQHTAKYLAKGWDPSMESNVLSPYPGESSLQTPPAPLKVFSLPAYCYAERQVLLPALNSVLLQCGGWMLERKATSPSNMEFVFEMQLQTILELYASLVSIGVELTRAAHATLTELCTCMRHGSSVCNPWQVLTLSLEVHFLADVTLHSILMTGADLA